MSTTDDTERERLRKRFVPIFTELENNLADPKSLLGYGHAVECSINILLADRKQTAKAIVERIRELGPKEIISFNDNDAGHWTNECSRLWRAVLREIENENT